LESAVYRLAEPGSLLFCNLGAREGRASRLRTGSPRNVPNGATAGELRELLNL
jgi:hypothetical protein